MKSLEGGVALVLGVPSFLAVALIIGLPGDGNSFVDLAGGACILWFFTAVGVLVLAVPRVSLGRRWGSPLEQDWVWVKRQRTALWEGFKVSVACIAAFGLVLWANHSFLSSTPTDHDVTIELSAGISSLMVAVPRPQPDDCPTEGAIVLSHRGKGSPRLRVDGEMKQPKRHSAHRVRYRVPLRSERSTYSCYYDFPKVVAGAGAVPVRLSVVSLGSAADSTPGPTGFRGNKWEWRCRALPDGEGCSVLAVLNADPASAASSLALLVAGAALAAVISLLVSVLLALWRGWVDDLTSVGRMLRKVGNRHWNAIRTAWDEFCARLRRRARPWRRG